MREILAREAPVALSEAQIETFCRFGEALLEQNKVMNLTAITEPEDVARLHFVDCMALLTLADLRGKMVVDVGCGAGFPGVPLKIAEPSIRLTLLDSLGKRMLWLARVLPKLGVEAEVVTGRAEEVVAGCREQFDVATSRAVARLNVPSAGSAGRSSGLRSIPSATPCTVLSSSAKPLPRPNPIPDPSQKSKKPLCNECPGALEEGSGAFS